jgi:hypothetical protein
MQAEGLQMRWILSLDLAVGKIPVNNKIKLPIQWGMDVDPPWKQPVSSMFTPGKTLLWRYCKERLLRKA